MGGDERARPVLRPATDADLAFAYEIKKVALREYVEQTWGWDEDYQWQRHVEGFDPARAQIATYRGVDVGWLGVQREEQEIRVLEVFISPAYQGRGMGTFLLGQLLGEARERGVPVKLRVLRVNTRAKRLYERLGSSVVSETETHYVMEAFP